MSTCVRVGVGNVDHTRDFCFYEMQILMFREALILGKNTILPYTVKKVYVAANTFGSYDLNAS